jgi:hypothetical protein
VPSLFGVVPELGSAIVAQVGVDGKLTEFPCFFGFCSFSLTVWTFCHGNQKLIMSFFQFKTLFEIGIPEKI